ncbi:MAG: DNA primase DnaG [Candidatus Woesearchaeota archaeon]|nr:DNA primase DnaG [Candidatus Woesearchaeota archaeon]
MGKISPVAAKYIVTASIEIDGVVDRPDVIGAIFGQTEGLLGSELELRELQRSGRIGRIEVNVDTRTGKTKGEIIVPSSLDKAETAIIAAAFEIIQRIGPCNAKLRVNKIEDVRVSKRTFVVERAKELLKNLMDSSMPDSQELADEVAHSVRVMEIREYGHDRLPAGPGIDEVEDIIVVEGRADVLTLLKHNIKNVIAMNGSVVPQTIIDLSKKKEVTVFMDGDRGGLLNIKELLQVASIDFVTKAPTGKEVEELTKKEIHQCLRAKITAEQATEELAKFDATGGRDKLRRNLTDSTPVRDLRPGAGPGSVASAASFKDRPQPMGAMAAPRRQVRISPDEKDKFKGMLDDLVGTRGAYILDTKLNILGKVPMTELVTTVKAMGSGVYALVFDGSIEKDLVDVAEKSNIQHLIGSNTHVNPMQTRVNLITEETLA